MLYKIMVDLPHVIIIAMEEIWKDIRGYEGIYQVSNCGRVKRLPRWIQSTKPHMLKERILIPSNQDGYRYVLFSVEGRRKTMQVHRLVLCTFTDKPLDYPFFVNHIDFDKSNNHIGNLEWVTPKENISHFIEYGGWRYDAWRNNIINSKKGRKMSKEQIEKQRKMFKGKGNPFYGKHHSEETKKKISETKKAAYQAKRS